MENIIEGDLYQPGRPTGEIAMSLAVLLQETLPKSKFSVVGRTSSTSRSIDIGILEHTADLADKGTLKALEDALRQTAQRFMLDRSVRHADHIERNFDLTISVHEDYWSRRQAKTLSPNFKPFGPGAFYKALSVGDRLRDNAAGVEYQVLSKSPGRFITDNGRGFGRKQWHIPRAAALRIHDNQLRIANGGLHNPDDHLLLDWIKN